MVNEVDYDGKANTYVSLKTFILTELIQDKKQ